MKVGVKKRWTRRDREDLVWFLQFAAVLWTCVLGLGPIVLAMIVGMIQGNAGDGVTTQAPGYPAFTTLSAGMIVPTLLLVAAFVISIPLPLKAFDAPKRYELVGYSVFVMAVAGQAAVLEILDARWVTILGVASVLTMMALIPLILLRSFLGWVRLVPRAWHEQDPKRMKRPRVRKAVADARAYRRATRAGKS